MSRSRAVSLSRLATCPPARGRASSRSPRRTARLAFDRPGIRTGHRRDAAPPTSTRGPRAVLAGRRRRRRPSHSGERHTPGTIKFQRGVVQPDSGALSSGIHIARLEGPSPLTTTDRGRPSLDHGRTGPSSGQWRAPAPSMSPILEASINWSSDRHLLDARALVLGHRKETAPPLGHPARCIGDGP